jgi:hypothetical protein
MPATGFTNIEKKLWYDLTTLSSPRLADPNDVPSKQTSTKKGKVRMQRSSQLLAFLQELLIVSIGRDFSVHQ